jgi:hypothetical protein
LTTLDLHNNQMDCLIPSELPASLTYIDLSGNNFNHLNDLSNHFNPYPSFFSVANNNLKFGDIEPNFLRAGLSNYSPQDSINQNQVVTVSAGQSFTLTTNLFTIDGI